MGSHRLTNAKKDHPDMPPGLHGIYVNPVLAFLVYAGYPASLPPRGCPSSSPAGHRRSCLERGSGHTLHRINNTLLLALGSGSYIVSNILLAIMKVDSVYWAYIFPSLVLGV